MTSPEPSTPEAEPSTSPSIVIVLPVVQAAAVLAVDALPVKFAVIVPAEKLPEPSLFTNLLAVLALVAPSIMSVKYLPPITKWFAAFPAVSVPKPTYSLSPPLDPLSVRPEYASSPAARVVGFPEVDDLFILTIAAIFVSY